MKIRIIDTQLIPAVRRPVDDTWAAFANHLITAFGEITQQNGFTPTDVELVYCHHRLREIDEGILSSLVYNVPPAFVGADVLLGEDSEHTAQSYFDSRLQWRSSKESPFLLLGYIGTGKTAFLDYYFYTYLPKHKNNIFAAIVSFKTAPDKDDAFLMRMIERVDNYLSDIQPRTGGMTREILELLFAQEIANINSSIHNTELRSLEIDRLFAKILRCKIENDIKTYALFVGRKIAQLKENGNSLWIVLDNIDQHYHCLHHRAFVNTVSVVDGWQCPLIIAMRYVTLHTPDARQTYDSFQPRRLKLSFPHLGELIQKRIDFFKLLADPLVNSPLKWTNNTLRVSDLASEISECAKLLAQRSFLMEFLLPLANYNLRRLLDMLLSALQSYYFFFDRFNNDRYLPNALTIRKRFVFAHLLKNNDYFDPSSRTDMDQFVVNLFENENPASLYNQTIRIRLLQALMYFGRHMKLFRFVNYLQALFTYEREDILNALNAFLEKELIALKNIISPTFDDSVLSEGLQEKHLLQEDIEIALTYSGRLHYDMMYLLEYVEIMKFSTYIDEPIYRDIQDASKQDTFERRSRSTRRFLEYLLKQEEIEISQCVKDKTRFDLQIRRTMPELQSKITKVLHETAELPEHRGSS